MKKFNINYKVRDSWSRPGYEANCILCFFKVISGEKQLCF